MKHKLAMLAAAGLVAASISTTQAQPYYASGDFNVPAWSQTSANELTLAGTVYSNSTSGQTPNGMFQCKIATFNWGSSWPSYNISGMWNANGSNNIYFQPGSFADGWTPAANRIGFDDPGQPWEIIGAFNGWDGSQPANAQMTSNGQGLYTVAYVVTNAGTYAFNFRTSGHWDKLRAGQQIFNNNGQDGSFSTTTSPETMTFQIDLPNGRYRVFDAALLPVTNQVVFAVDMSSQIQLGYFTPGDSVYVAGDFNTWPGPGGGLVLTNYPPYNGGSNTNIYYGTNTFVGSPSSSPTKYKFNDNDPSAPNGGWETSPDKTLTLLSTNGTLMLPVANFNNVTSSDYLNVDTSVTFTVNMTNAYSIARTNIDPGVSTNIYPPVAFSGQAVYITGNFADNGWAASPWTPPHLIQMTETPPGSLIYSYTYPVKTGHPVEIHYKYAFDDGGPLDDEAPAYQDHIRYVRTTATGSYTNALDTFGNQYVEPSFGQLAVGAPAGGAVGLTWLGRPGVYVQTCTNLTGGSWVNHTNTDGIYWDIGSYSTNGLVSATNWPAGGGSQFFRLIKP